MPEQKKPSRFEDPEVFDLKLEEFEAVENRLRRLYTLGTIARVVKAVGFGLLFGTVISLVLYH